MAKARRRSGLIGRIVGLGARKSGSRRVQVGTEPRPVKGDIRLSRDQAPFILTIADRKFLLLFDWPMNRSSKPYPRDWIIAQESGPGEVVPFFRVKEGSVERLEYDNRAFRKIFGLTRETAASETVVSNVGTDLELSVGGVDSPVTIQRAGDIDESSQFSDGRLEKLEKLRKVYGGDFRILAHNEAADAAETACKLFQRPDHRPKTAAGVPGGLLDFPPDFVPIIIGDLHGAVDNLLKALCQNRFLDMMEAGDAGLILLGDVIHGEEDGKLRNMSESTLMLDLIFKLKISFPSQVFMLRGNHESFNPEIVKGGVPQGLLYRKHLLETRGQAYVDTIGEFFESLPFVARSDRFVATHAAPTRGKVTYDVLVDLAKYPGLVHEVTWNRLQRPGFPAGYVKGDVKRFRKSLGVEKDTPMIVGHTPLDSENAYWVRAGNIKQHYIVYSARTDRFGVITMVGDRAIALDYNCEKLTPKSAKTD